MVEAILGFASSAMFPRHVIVRDAGSDSVFCATGGNVETQQPSYDLLGITQRATWPWASASSTMQLLQPELLRPQEQNG